MIRINLAPPRQRKRFSLSVPSFNLGLLFGLLTVLSIVTVAGWWWSLRSEATHLEGEIGMATRQLETLKVAIAEGNKYKAERDDLERRVAAIEELTTEQPRPIYLMDALAEAIPRDLWLTNAGERDKQLRLSGTAFSATALADFMSNLRSSGKFKEVDLVVSRQDLTKTPQAITFEVVCRFEI
jgi:Tfp pilus assembly protein PilN